MTTTPRTITEGAARENRFRGLLGVAVQILLLGWIVLAALAVLGNREQRGLLERVKTRPWSVTMAEVRADDARIHALNVAAVALLLVTGLAFVTWLFVEYRRVDRQGGRVRYRTGWAIGGWVVPFANLYIPFMVVEDVWRAAARPAPDASQYEDEPNGARRLPVVGLWWAGWLGGLLVAAGASSKADDANTVDDLLSANGRYLARDVIAGVTAVLAIVIVQRVRKARVVAVPAGDPEFWMRDYDRLPEPIETASGEETGS